MERKTIDLWVSIGGLIMTVVLIVAGFLLLWGWSYTHDQVRSELSAQKIFFPPANSPAIAAPEFAPMHQYAGQQLTTGPQAKVYANSFIANHLKEVANGQTYAQVSGQLQQDPNNAQLQKQTQTLFQGETLRGLLLTSYGFSIFGDRAQTVAYLCYGLAAVLFVASIAGLLHARKRSAERELVLPRVQGVPADN